MASLQNRSPLVVTVARKPDLKREFRFDQPEKADEYIHGRAEGAGSPGWQDSSGEGESARFVRYRLDSACRIEPVSASMTMKRLRT